MTTEIGKLKDGLNESLGNIKNGIENKNFFSDFKNELNYLQEGVNKLPQDQESQSPEEKENFNQIIQNLNGKFETFAKNVELKIEAENLKSEINIQSDLNNLKSFDRKIDELIAKEKTEEELRTVETNKTQLEGLKQFIKDPTKTLDENISKLADAGRKQSDLIVKDSISLAKKFFGKTPIIGGMIVNVIETLEKRAA